MAAPLGDCLHLFNNLDDIHAAILRDWWKQMCPRSSLAKNKPTLLEARVHHIQLPSKRKGKSIFVFRDSQSQTSLAQALLHVLWLMEATTGAILDLCKTLKIERMSGKVLKIICLLHFPCEDYEAETQVFSWLFFVFSVVSWNTKEFTWTTSLYQFVISLTVNTET